MCLKITKRVIFINKNRSVICFPSEDIQLTMIFNHNINNQTQNNKKLMIYKVPVQNKKFMIQVQVKNIKKMMTQSELSKMHK